MTGLAVSARLARWIEQAFPAGTAVRVLEELRALPPDVLGGQGVERIQAALVVRTRGEWSAFESQLALVQIDFRDALMNADLGHADWPQRLEGILGPA